MRDFLTDETGTANVWNILMTVVFLMIGGLSVDYANGLRVRNAMQAAIDATVTAAARDLPDETLALSAALEYAGMVGGGAITLTERNFEFGQWDEDRGYFVRNARPYNAVRGTAWRSEAEGTGLGTLLLKLAGVDALDVRVEAIARAPNYPACAHGGFLAESAVVAGDLTDFVRQVCLHGLSAVAVGNANYFESGTMVSSTEEQNVRGGFLNRGLDEAKTSRHAMSRLPRKIDNIAKKLSRSLQSGLVQVPASILQGPFPVATLPANPMPGGLYVLSGGVVIPNGMKVRDLAVITEGDITVEPFAELEGVVLVAGGRIEIGAGASIGPNAPCTRDAYDSYLLAKEGIRGGFAAHYRGVQFATEGDIDYGLVVGRMEGVLAEAMGVITLGSAEEVAGCDVPLETALGDFSKGPDLNPRTALVR